VYRPRSSTIDAALAGAVTAATLFPALRPPMASPGWIAVLLALAASVPLAWRRRAIVPVALVVGCATTGLSVVDRLPPLPYGMLVCTYTFATLGSAPLRRFAVALTALGVTGSLLLTGDNVDSYGYVGMAYTGAYALGASARARDTEVRLLREQAADQARRLEEARIAAVARERTRIARDMHDVVGHAVTLIAVAAEAGPVVVRSDPHQAETLFAAISSTAREALGQIRRTVGALRHSGSSPTSGLPSGLRSGPGLDGAPDPAPDPAATVDVAGLGGLPDLVARTGASGLTARLVEHGGRVTVAADVNVAAYRIVQEALTNAVRHSGASSVHVGLTWSPANLRLEVRDDGRPGPPPLRPAGTGYGLIGMRERAAACGGTLAAGPAPGGGFLVVADLPLGSEL
jgi:signal transduction histidine kinase